MLDLYCVSFCSVNHLLTFVMVVIGEATSASPEEVQNRVDRPGTIGDSPQRKVKCGKIFITLLTREELEDFVTKSSAKKRPADVQIEHSSAECIDQKSIDCHCHNA